MAIGKRSKIEGSKTLPGLGVADALFIGFSNKRVTDTVPAHEMRQV